jgi:uncharacterized glyoxalase superfamily protein PhnB
MITSVNVYLYFPGNTEEAFTAYRTIFGGDFSAVVRFRDFPDNPMRIPEADLDRRLGLNAEARAAYEQSLVLARQAPERRFLRRRLAELP